MTVDGAVQVTVDGNRGAGLLFSLRLQTPLPLPMEISMAAASLDAIGLLTTAKTAVETA
jgi:hypothetical protein